MSRADLPLSALMRPVGTLAVLSWGACNVPPPANFRVRDLNIYATLFTTRPFIMKCVQLSMRISEIHTLDR